MVQKLTTLWPEITLLIGACVCLGLGLSGRQGLRRATAWVAGLVLLVAGAIAYRGIWSGDGTYAGDGTAFIKLAAVGIGLLLIMLMAHLPEQGERGGDTTEPDRAVRGFHGEFFAFFLLSLTGAMLCAGAGDLAWLFLALELTSLPTYVLVATARNRQVSQEAAVKYFFLGAFAAATFLYGFALIYGATGSTEFTHIRASAIASVQETGGLPPLMTAGLVLSILGICFKISAVPMHFYVADVYQGAATPVTAMLAFVPKMAGFLALIAILGLVGWNLPEPVTWILWILAVLSMTVGNALGLLQHNVKRVLAYSSVAHSGYMIVGLLAGAAMDPGQAALDNGVAAVLFYLLGYGLATLGAFGVLSCLHANGVEAETYDDIAELSRRNPGLAAIMLISVMSLLGFPLTIGFLGKVYLFGSALTHGFIWLVVIALINSAVSAVYYLRIVGTCYFGRRSDDRNVITIAAFSPRLATSLSGAVVLILFLFGGVLVTAARDAAEGGFWDQTNRPGTTGLVDVHFDGAEAEPRSAEPTEDDSSTATAASSSPSALSDPP